MIQIPVRKGVARSAEERAARSARLRRVLGSVGAWPEDWRVELVERLGLADGEVETEVVEAFRTELLRRLG